MLYTDKQKIALKRLNEKTKIYYLLEGGSRSGKTYLVCRYLVMRACRYANTRHLICRQSKTSCVATVWRQTLMEVLKDFKGVWSEDKSNRIINFVNGSSIWAGGFENKLHEDAVLGSEFATIFINEAIDSGYSVFNKLRTRLNWKTISLKLIADCNPKAPSHWVSKFFHKGVDPEDNKSLPERVLEKICTVHFHPLDNKRHLSREYLEQLENLKGVAKKRFWDGIWAEDIEGLVYYSFDRRVNVVKEKLEIVSGAETFTTWDFGTADPTSIIVGQIVPVHDDKENFPGGYRINIIDEYENVGKDVIHYADWCKSRPWFQCSRKIRHYGDPSGKNRDAQLKSWISLLYSCGITIEYTTKYKIDDYISDADRQMPFVRANEQQTPNFIEMCENWKYPLDKDGKKMIGSKPEHNRYSHAGTAWYYFTANRLGSRQASMEV